MGKDKKEGIEAKHNRKMLLKVKKRKFKKREGLFGINVVDSGSPEVENSQRVSKEDQTEETNRKNISTKLRKRKLQEPKRHRRANDPDGSPSEKDREDQTEEENRKKISTKLRKRMLKEPKRHGEANDVGGSSSEKGARSRRTLKENPVDHSANLSQLETLNAGGECGEPGGANGAVLQRKTKKAKKGGKRKKMDIHVINGENKLEQNLEPDSERIDEISSVDGDCSRGMQKWLMEHKQSRLGLKVLQDRIDEFMTAYEAQQEKERKEREAHAAEEGWTVVAHHKGRKKTTDAETGTTVGSVARAAVMDKMAKKKSKEVTLDFYRFQKRDAKRNEIMMLQSKFEQDKKRIQQLRAARKFRPL